MSSPSCNFSMVAYIFGTLTYFVKCLLNDHKETRVGEEVAELLLIACICINHTEIESKITSIYLAMKMKFISSMVLEYGRIL